MSPSDERFTGLFARTSQALLAYAVRRVADPADAADVVADTFLVAWRRLDSIPEGRERAWLFGVARRVLANRNRGTRRNSAMVERLRAGLAAVPRQATSGRPALAEALDRLPEGDRELLRLLAWEELTQEEAAVALGTSVGAIRVRLHRARARLRAELAAIESQPSDTLTTTGLPRSAR